MMNSFCGFIWFSFGSLLIFGSHKTWNVAGRINNGNKIDIVEDNSTFNFDFRNYVKAEHYNFSDYVDEEVNEHRHLQTCTQKGVTWKLGYHSYKWGFDYIHCYGCDPYTGDTPCSTKLPILCKKVNGQKRAPYNVPDCKPDCAMNKEFYHGWVNGNLKKTQPILGCTLTSRAVADNICVQKFGTGWSMVEHEDGYHKVGMHDTLYIQSNWTGPFASGGWAVYGYGNVATTSRMWTAINSQPANCWDSST